jgi:hypothetical protein
METAYTIMAVASSAQRDAADGNEGSCCLEIHQPHPAIAATEITVPASVRARPRAGTPTVA